MSKHTPWRITKSKCEMDLGYVIVDNQDKVVATTFDKECAEFIVRACNSYDDLLEACEYVLRVLNNQFVNGAGTTIAENILDKKIQEVVKKAKGEV